MILKRMWTPCQPPTPPKNRLFWIIILCIFMGYSASTWATTNENDLEGIRKAATAGNAEAQNRLGTIYLSGQGVTPDPNLAASWFQSASNQGHPGAQVNLGTMHFGGMGISQDLIQASLWFKKAATQNNLEAQMLLGHMYLNGTGVAKDPHQALKWYGMAAAQGNQEAVRQRDQLMAASLPPPQTAPNQQNSAPVMIIQPATVTVLGDSSTQAPVGKPATATKGNQENARQPNPRMASLTPQKTALSHQNATPIITIQPATVTVLAAPSTQPAKTEQTHPATPETPATATQAIQVAKAEATDKPDTKAEATDKPASKAKPVAKADATDKPATKAKPVAKADATDKPATKAKPVAKAEATNKPTSKEIQVAQLVELNKPNSGRRSATQTPNPTTTPESSPTSTEKSTLDASQEWEKSQTTKSAPQANATKITSLLSAPPPPPAPNKNPKAAKEAESGKQFLQENQLPEAILHYTKAHEQDPGNLDWLHNVATLSLTANEHGPALEYFRKATAVAVATGKTEDAIQYTKEISKILNQTPAWVDEALAKAGLVPDEKAQAADMWSKARETALQAAQNDDLDAAIRFGKQSLDMAKENLGAQHASTFMSERELGTYYTLANKTTEATPILQQALTHAKTALGADHPETLAADKANAQLLERQGQLPAAIKLYQASQAAYNAKLGNKHPLAMENDLALSRAYQNLAQYDQANTLLKETCPKIAQEFGYHHPETAKCLNQFASLQQAQEEIPASLATYEQALAIQQATLPKEDPDLLPTWLGLADTNRRLGQFKKAHELLSPILTMEKPGTHSSDPLLIEAKTILTHLHLDQGDFKSAEPLAKQLVEQLTTELGNEHPTTLGIRTDLAAIHEKLGRLEEAETEIKQTLKIYQKIFGETHPVAITTMNNLGQVLEVAGLYDDAEPLLRQALNLAEKNIGADHPLTLTTMNNLALLHESQGNFDNAEPLYQNAITSYRKRLGDRHADTLAVINNLAYLHLLQQNYAKAAPLFKKILAIWTETLGEKHQRTLKAMNNLARTTHHLGQFKEAETLFLKALDLRRKVFGEHHMDVLRTMHDLSLLYRDMGRLKESEELLRKTRIEDEKVLGTLHPYTFETLNTLASVLEKINNPEAFQLHKEIFNRRSDFLDRMLWSTGDNAREGYIRLYTPELHNYLALLTKTDKAIAGRELLEVGLRRKGLLLKIASEIQQTVRLSNDPQLKATSDQLTATRKQLGSLTLSGPTPETAEKHMEIINQLEREVDELQQKLGKASQQFQHATAKISVDDLIKQLPNKTALVEFMIFKEGEQSKLLAAILKKEHDQPTFDLAVYNDLDAIQKGVIDYRALIQEEGVEENDLKKLGQSVYNQLWAPIKTSIGNLETVYLVPDGLLNILPFPALVDPDEIYLTRSTDLHFLTSNRDLLPLKQPLATGNFLIVASPDYDSDKINVSQTQVLKEAQGRRSAEIKQGLRALSSGMRGLNFSPLPGAEKEGNLISNQIKEKKKTSSILLKVSAQEGTLQSLPTPPRILHIATHGFFLKPDDSLRKRLLKLARGAELKLPPPGDNPLLRSGLAFAGINPNAQFLGELETNNDGILTALEVLGLDLTGTQLAVLSACETGLGEIHEGEGIYGLRRAFQEAGAQSVISSLWEVSDAGTQILMTNLYARLGDGMPAHKALREAQLDLLESDTWNQPYIWSAFMMVGQ